MAVNIFRDEMQHARLFGKPVLTINWLISRETVPDGWFCYDMRGTESNPAAHAELVDYTGIDHSGTVLSPKPLKRPTTKARRIREGDYILHGETMDLESFCEEYGLDFPDNPIKFEMRPASSAQAPYPSPRRKRQGSLIPPRLLSTSNPLRWRHLHGGEIAGGACAQNYGYVMETDQYRYCLRCNPVRGDYQAYLTAFDLRVQEMHQAREQAEGPKQEEPMLMDGMG